MVKFKVEDANFNKIYPVGAIYMSVNSTNPSELFGGEWEQIKDRFLLACGTTHSNGEMDGAETVSLTEQEMPRHTHTQNQHRHTMPYNWSTGSGSSSGYTYSSNRQTTTIYTEYATPTNQYTGGTNTTQAQQNGKAHNNMPPYLAVYCWVRTA